MIKNAHHNFPKPKVMSSDYLISVQESKPQRHSCHKKQRKGDNDLKALLYRTVTTFFQPQQKTYEATSPTGSDTGLHLSVMY